MTRTINSKGQRSVSLAPAALKFSTIKLDKPEQERPHVNAAMPNAPQGFAWPHLRTPARFL